MLEGCRVSGGYRERRDEEVIFESKVEDVNMPTLFNREPLLVRARMKGWCKLS